ncbi:hypothetical protein [Streptomyces californicus]
MPKRPDPDPPRPLFELRVTVHRVPGELIVGLVAALGALIAWITAR